MKVRDIMTRPAVSVREDITLKEAAAIMADQRFSGVPVVNNEGRVVGVITEADVLRHAGTASHTSLRDSWGWVSPYSDPNDFAQVRTGFERMATTTVGELMSKKVFTVTQDTEMEKAAAIMTKNRVNRLPVVDVDGRLVGIVTRADIVRAVAEA